MSLEPESPLRNAALIAAAKIATEGIENLATIQSTLDGLKVSAAGAPSKSDFRTLFTLMRGLVMLLIRRMQQKSFVKPQKL